MPTTKSRVLCTDGAALPSNEGFKLLDKVVKNTHKDSKFSRRPPSRSAASDIACLDSNAPSAARSPVSPRNRRHYSVSPSREAPPPRPVTRSTGFEARCKAQEEYRESHPRTMRRIRSVSPGGRGGDHASIPASPILAPGGAAGGGFDAAAEVHKSPSGRSRPERLLSVSGTSSGGRRPSPLRNIASMEAPADRAVAPGTFFSTQRFRSSARKGNAGSDVTRPETLPNTAPPVKKERFAASPRPMSLVGVMAPEPKVAAPAYRPMAPFHTD